MKFAFWEKCKHPFSRNATDFSPAMDPTVMAADGADFAAGYNSIAEKHMTEFMKETTKFVTGCLSNQNNADFEIFRRKGLDKCLIPAAAFPETEKAAGHLTTWQTWNSQNILDLGGRNLICAETALASAADREDFETKMAICGVQF